MTYEATLALAGFALISSITPGPNNLMLMASGANFGFRRTLPHMLGVSLGHCFLVLCCGVALSGIFQQVPQLQTVLKVLAVGYLLWLAFKIASAAPKDPKAPETAGKPLTFLQAAGFQWVNPKGWSMALTASTVYGGPEFLEAIAVAGTFVSMNWPAISLWAVLGTQIARFLHSPKRMRVFNAVMALLLVATLVPILS